MGFLPVLWIAVRDDLRPVRPLAKLLYQAVGASIAVGFGIGLPGIVHLFGMPVHLGWAAAPLSVAWIVGVTNAFNLIDGLDGLCAGLAAISAGAMGLVFLITNQPALAIIAAVVAGAISGFLPHNIHPARVFLGDSGAMSVGFSLACLALAGGATLSSGFAALLPAIILGLPIAEIVVSFFRRLFVRASGERKTGVMVADRSHFHHRLMDLGLAHPRAVWVLYIVGGFLAFVSLLSIMLTARQAGLLLLLLLVAAAVGVKRLGYGGSSKTRDERQGVRRALFIGFADVSLALTALALAVGVTGGWSGREFRNDMGAEEIISYGLATLLSFWGVGLYQGTWWLKSRERFLRLLVGVAIAPFLVALLMLVVQEPRMDAVLLANWTVLHLGAVLTARSAHHAGAERMGTLWTGSRRDNGVSHGVEQIEAAGVLRGQRLTESQVAVAVSLRERARALDDRAEGQRKAG
jgi:UDP-GlcNAc:undecaprenyl-phosphate GlcNAc-1-phosphate transferase